MGGLLGGGGGANGMLAPPLKLLGGGGWPLLPPPPSSYAYGRMHYSHFRLARERENQSFVSVGDTEISILRSGV